NFSLVVFCFSDWLGMETKDEGRKNLRHPGLVFCFGDWLVSRRKTKDEGRKNLRHPGLVFCFGSWLSIETKDEERKIFVIRPSSFVLANGQKTPNYQ
ncbi:MAG: hypothetical protein N2383_14780, partial [Caldilineales bacterium]|nr:hypothetical protein [Caldilineales bacterium]